VIPVPKFSESHPLSLRAIYILMIIAFVWLYAWALGEIIPRLMNEDFRDEVYEDSRPNMRTQIFSFQSNAASVLERIAFI
jgi:hypothetical protein